MARLRWLLGALCVAAVVCSNGCVSAPLYTRGTPGSGAGEPAEPPPPRGRDPVAASVVPLPPDDPPRRGRERVVSTFSGEASYYAHEFHGRKTANGERYDMYEMTAAHRTLAFGTMVRVSSSETGKSVVVRVNDRGPFKKGRVLDVSLAAAKKLGMIGPGTLHVKCEVLE